MEALPIHGALELAEDPLPHVRLGRHRHGQPWQLNRPEGELRGAGGSRSRFRSLSRSRFLVGSLLILLWFFYWFFGCRSLSLSVTNYCTRLDQLLHLCRGLHLCR